MTDSYKTLECRISDFVAEVLMLGAGKGNALGPDLFREMPLLFAELDRDDKVRAVILGGSGNNFSFGMDLLGMFYQFGPLISGESMADTRTRLYEAIREMQKFCTCVAECRKPVIAAVQGWCIGGGLDLISACDIRLCSSDAKFSFREVKLAMVGDIGGLQRLPGIIGQGAARELALTGRDITADEAHHMRLVNHVYDSREALYEGARAMAQEIAENAPLVVAGIKHVMNYCADKSIEEGLNYVALWNSAFLQSLDLAEALSAFAEKRKPEYHGK